ncbi:MAG: acyl-CoA dehydrogenase family protein [Thermoanaerobaculia bacterium]|nr:acyl-CoA dehydrogenase family protein [Thermoanaerobaculia bacterium]
MPDRLPAELADLRHRLHHFLDDELLPMEHTLHLGPDDPVPPEVADWTRQRSREAGFFGMTQPEDLGGSGAGPLALTVVREALAESDLRLAAFVLGPSPGVLAAAEGELRRTHLRPVLDGERRSAFAFTEPQDAHHPTSARRDGDDLVVHGSKAFVTGGADADFYLTLVRVAEDGDLPAGTAMIVIDRDAPGVHIEEEFHSLDGSHHVSLHFHDTRVPKSHVVGAIGEGMPRALGNIGEVRLALAAQACGICMFVLESLVDHLRASHRSGTPLGDRESIRLRYGEMRTRAYAARSMLYRTARLAAAGENTVNEVMATKVFCVESVGCIVDQAIQMVGGRGLIHGHPLERLYRRVRALRLAEGASDLLRLQIARGRLELDKGRI